jgi:hypothetical protein
MMSKYDGANDGVKKGNPNPEVKPAGSMRLMMEKKAFQGNTVRTQATPDGSGGKNNGARDPVKGGKVWE